MSDNPNQNQKQNATNEGDKNIESDVNSSGNYIKILLVYFIYQCPASTFIILQWWPDIITAIYEVFFSNRRPIIIYLFFQIGNMMIRIQYHLEYPRKQMLNITCLTEYKVNTGPCNITRPVLQNIFRTGGWEKTLRQYITRWTHPGIGIPLTDSTTPHYFSCPKQGPSFQTVYIVVFFVFTDLRWEVLFISIERN